MISSRLEKENHHRCSPNKRAGMTMSCVMLLLIIASSLCIVDAFTTPITVPQHQKKIGLSTSSSSPVTTRRRNCDALLCAQKTTPTADDNDDDNENEEEKPKTTPSRFLHLQNPRLLRRLKPVALAFFTAAIGSNTRHHLLSNQSPPNSLLLTTPPAASASGPIMPIRKRVYEDPMVVAKKKALEYRMKRDQAKVKDLLNEISHIESTKGKAAAQAYEKQQEEKQEDDILQKKAQRPKLLLSLLEEGMCPFTDTEGVRQLFLFDEEYDLAKVADTEQSIDAIMLKQNSKKFLEERSYPRYVVKCIVQDLKLKGEDPVEYFEKHQENTKKIYQMRPQDAKKMAEAYRSVMEKQGSLTAPDVIRKIRVEKGLPEDPSEDATKVEEVKAAAAATTAVAGKSASSSRSRLFFRGRSKEAREARLAKRAEAVEARTQRRAARKAAKAERRAARVQAREEAAAKKKKEAAGAAAKTAVAAGAAATAAGAAATTKAGASIADAAKAAKHPAADSEIAATSGMDFAATAGQEAVSRSALESTEDDAGTNKKVETKKPLSIVKASAVVALGGGGAFAFKTMKDKAAEEEEERQRQFKLIMGMDEDDNDDDDEEENGNTIADDWMTGGTSEPEQKKSSSSSAPSAASAELPKKKKKKRGFGSIFSKASDRETDIFELIKPEAENPEFALLLAKILTYGAPGRFPDITAQPGGMPFEDEETTTTTTTSEDGTTETKKEGGFNLDQAKIMLMESRLNNPTMTEQGSAELFASVVNCMIIDIIDLASSSLKSKKDKDTVAALNVVMDFMDHAASLFDAVAEGVTITPVTYCGTLGKGRLEEMYGIYAGSALGLEGATQDRIDTLQQVFSIADKKAEGLVQKTMMKNLMKMMKDGGEGMEGMEGMGDLMSAMGGGGDLPGMGGLPGMGDGDISPEELKQSVAMMKELMDSGQISKDEIAEVRKQFETMYGSDISELIKAADEEGAADELGEEGKELLDLFKAMLKDE